MKQDDPPTNKEDSEGNGQASLVRRDRVDGPLDVFSSPFQRYNPRSVAKDLPFAYFPLLTNPQGIKPFLCLVTEMWAKACFLLSAVILCLCTHARADVGGVYELRRECQIGGVCRIGWTTDDCTSRAGVSEYPMRKTIDLPL